MHLTEIYDDIPLGVLIVKRDRQNMDILYANPAALLCMTAWDIGECEDLERRLKSPNPPREYTLMLDHDTENRWIKMTISQGDFNGEEAFYLWTTDISANKESEAKLKEQVERADAAAEMKSNFLATMSHEIRTPMQSVYGMLELIGEEKPPPGIQTLVDTAKTSASSLLEILDDILDFAKIDADKMELDVFEVPVRTLVRGVIEALAVKLHGKKVVLVDDIAEAVPFVIIGDPKRLRQILINLTGNALKFTEEGTVTLRVTAGTKVIPEPRHGIGLRFEIIDTGIGMSDEVASRLFSPFVQADSSTSRKFGGTGLGLSICRKLVELMGGQIGVNSREGHGSTFWFEIPTEEVSTDTTTVDLPSLDGISVLSVENHPQGAREILRSLQSMGANVDSVPTYREGLDLARLKPYDVGIVDQGLPDGLGIDLIREIMEIRPFMGLVMYTVRDDIGLTHSLQSLGAKYLPKPASRAGLGEAVKDAARAVVKMDTSGPDRLLIAEDTESVRYVLKQQLDKLGIEADFVDDGKKALEAVDTGNYGILITDLHMPNVDGYGVVRRIRDKEQKGDRHMPVVVLTADVHMAQRHIYLGHGFDESLIKPVTMGQLRRLLVRWGLLSEETEDKIDDASSSQETDTPAENPEIPAIDRETMIDLIGVFDESSIEMLKMFVEMTEPQIEELKTALDHQDHPRMREVAHSLKGASRSACANVLGDMAAELQDTAEAGNPCEKLVDKVLAEFERVRTEINEMKV